MKVVSGKGRGERIGRAKEGGGVSDPQEESLG